MSIEVELKDWEIMLGAFIGIQRQVNGILRGFKHKYGMDPVQGWNNHIEGALGEIAAARALGLRVRGRGDPGDPDIGETTEVRTRKRGRDYLLLQKDSHDDRRYFLVTGGNGKYSVEGWIWGRDAKLDEYWKDLAHNGRGPCYWIPLDKLKPPEAKT